MFVKKRPLLYRNTYHQTVLYYYIPILLSIATKKFSECTFFIKGPLLTCDQFWASGKKITEWAKGLTSYEKDNVLQLRAMPANFVTSRKQIASPSQPLLRVMRWNLWVAKPNVGFTEVTEVFDLVC